MLASKSRFLLQRTVVSDGSKCVLRGVANAAYPTSSSCNGICNSSGISSGRSSFIVATGCDYVSSQSIKYQIKSSCFQTKNVRHFGSYRSEETSGENLMRGRASSSIDGESDDESDGESDSNDEAAAAPAVAAAGGEGSIKIKADNRGGKSKSSSTFRGVSSDRGMWKAQLYGNSISYFIGRFHDEQEAARAYDKKAREVHGDRARCNFDSSGNLVKLLTSKKRTYVPLDNPIVSLKTSRFLGVSFVNSRWLAKVSHKKITHYLGIFATEEEAAKAYDAKKREIAGPNANPKTNFDIDGKLRTEFTSVIKSREVIDKRSESKAKKHSRFRGVCFSFRKYKKWQAMIRKNKKLIYLGVYDTEEEAAKAYDAKARELNGALAMPNFDENGNEIDYTLSIDYFTKKRASLYRGVYLDTRRKSKQWRAGIVHNKKKIFLGNYDTEEAAALAYNKKALELYKEQADINMIVK